MARLTDEDRFNIEVIKLMLQVAWSDGRIDPREAGVIRGVARQWGVPESELASLKSSLEGRDEPPAPDLALLKPRADQVFEAVGAVIASDGRLDPAEKNLLQELRVILSPGS